MGSDLHVTDGKTRNMDYTLDAFNNRSHEYLCWDWENHKDNCNAQLLNFIPLHVTLLSLEPVDQTTKPQLSFVMHLIFDVFRLKFWSHVQKWNVWMQVWKLCFKEQSGAILFQASAITQNYAVCWAVVHCWCGGRYLFAFILIECKLDRSRAIVGKEKVVKWSVINAAWKYKKVESFY